MHLENVLNIFLQDVLKMSWRRFSKRLEDVLKTSWRLLGKTSWRCLEDVLKTSWRSMAKVNIFVLMKTSWRHLQDVFWRRRQKTSSGRLQDVFIKTNVCWVSFRKYKRKVVLLVIYLFNYDSSKSTFFMLNVGIWLCLEYGFWQVNWNYKNIFLFSACVF